LGDWMIDTSRLGFHAREPSSPSSEANIDIFSVNAGTWN
jgi:hypothetical protein